MTEHADGPDPRRWRMLALVSAAELLGMSLWFTANAAAPELSQAWSLSASQAGWMTTVVQLGFVAGTAAAAVLNLADLFPSRAYFSASALAGAAANAALLAAPGYEWALASRFATGFFLAGVYPPAMKMIATWFRDGRGLAIGTVVGALTVGKATPYLVQGLGASGFREVVIAGSAAAVLSALVVGLLYRRGPYPFERRPFSWALVGRVFRHRETRLAIDGYLGHMWELYAMWTWAPAFLMATAETRRVAGHAVPSAGAVELLAFGAVAAGGLGCVWGGWAADRVGRGVLVNRVMAVSGACSVGVGFLFAAPFWILAPVCWIWGFFVVADSAQFSALVTEVAPQHAVGTALTLQTSLGFLLTMVTIQGVPLLVDAAGWQWAFPSLALGPAFGIWSIQKLRRLRAGRS